MVQNERPIGFEESMDFIGRVSHRDLIDFDRSEGCRETEEESNHDQCDRHGVRKTIVFKRRPFRFNIRHLRQ